MPEVLFQTPRLLLRKFKIEDAENMYALNKDPEVVQYTGDKSFASVEEARNFLRDYHAYERYGMGRWLVIRKSDHACLGWCGLKMHTGNWVDLGYRFFKKYWNQGFATEAAAGCVKYGFEQLALTEIYATVMPINGASSRVLEKLGFRFFREVKEELMGQAHVYELRKENWYRS